MIEYNRISSIPSFDKLVESNYYFSNRNYVPCASVVFQNCITIPLFESSYSYIMNSDGDRIAYDWYTNYIDKSELISRKIEELCRYRDHDKSQDRYELLSHIVTKYPDAVQMHHFKECINSSMYRLYSIRALCKCSKWLESAEFRLECITFAKEHYKIDALDVMLECGAAGALVSQEFRNIPDPNDISCCGYDYASCNFQDDMPYHDLFSGKIICGAA